MRVIRDDQGPFVIINTALITALTPNEFIVYAQIKKRAGNDGECWESLEHMAQEVGMGKTTLRLALKGIARKNLVRKERQPGKTDLYSLTAPSEWRLEKLVDPDGSRLPTPLGIRVGVARNPTTEPARIPSTNKIPLELDPINTQEAHAKPELLPTDLDLSIARTTAMSIFLDPEPKAFGFQISEPDPNSSAVSTRVCETAEQPAEQVEARKLESFPWPEETIDSSSAGSTLPDTTPQPPSSPPAAQPNKLAAMLDRFRANSRDGGELPQGPVLDPQALISLQVERYAPAMEDPDRDRPSVSLKATEAPLDIFIAPLDAELDLSALLDIVGLVGDPLPGRAPAILVERLWDTYRQWRPNGWAEPAKIDESRVLRMAVDELWRQLASKAKTTAENACYMELMLRNALLYLYSKPWFSGPDFQNKHLTYLLTAKFGKPAPIETYSEQWRSINSSDQNKAKNTLRRLLEARDNAINN
jgi:hypothetical protein